jgi:hypothetical protein
MSTFPIEPPVTPAAPAPAEPAHRRALSQEELATLPLQALLVRAGHVTLDQLAEALRENVATGRSVEDIALSRGWISAEELSALRSAKASYTAGAPAPVTAAPVAQAPPPPAPVAQAPPPPPAPVAYVPEPPAPIAQAPAPPPAPIAEAPAPPPAPIAETPAAAPAPVVEAAASRAPVAADTSVGVFLNLEDGARIWAGRFDSLEDAERHAQQLTESLVRPEPGVWPRFGDQLVRPDAVVSVEVSPREER